MKLILETMDAFTLEAETVQDRAYLGQFASRKLNNSPITVRLEGSAQYLPFQPAVHDKNDIRAIRFTTR